MMVCRDTISAKLLQPVQPTQLVLPSFVRHAERGIGLWLQAKLFAIACLGNYVLTSKKLLGQKRD